MAAKKKSAKRSAKKSATKRVLLRKQTDPSTNGTYDDSSKAPFVPNAKTKKPRKVKKGKRSSSATGKGIAGRVALAFKLGRALGRLEGAGG